VYTNYYKLKALFFEMITREELKKEHPEYDDLLAKDKIALEISEDTYSGNFYKKAMGLGALVGSVGGPLWIKNLAKKGNIEPPVPLQYILSVPFGVFMGTVLGMSFGVLLYSAFNEEGELYQWFHRDND
jgi:hypothetical protein